MNYKLAAVAATAAARLERTGNGPAETQRLIDHAESRFTQAAGRFPYRSERGHIRNVLGRRLEALPPVLPPSLRELVGRVERAGVAYHNRDDGGRSERRYAEEQTLLAAAAAEAGFDGYDLPGLRPVLLLHGRFVFV